MKEIIDMNTAKDELSKEELQILNILIGKVQDADVSCDSVCNEGVEETYIGDYIYNLPRYEVFITDEGKEEFNRTVESVDEQDAILGWYKENGLEGDLIHDVTKGVWRYEGRPIKIKRVD